ncbi:hypothetical protein SAMN02799631_02238 [Methylobacterium sp. 174MFSha1.1]|uniref:hypothetical protein n=1 Tax=Methylobacterium sp. 174MFSha1.1 TaxID=1502749 RepID=UPI0008F01DB0|nr:hypothetical protein [Methylobacterium sp. 174MFSha1.1]SFU78085.1 hypothetical protein SAMN02799631_02238 [Methylobacterium sp. 174MFSha1.1]
MTRFVSIATAIAEAAAFHGRQPTAEQYARIENALREQIVIDFEAGLAGVCYGEGFVVDPAAFVANELTRPWIETRSTPWAASRSAPGF